MTNERRNIVALTDQELAAIQMLCPSISVIKNEEEIDKKKKRRKEAKDEEYPAEFHVLFKKRYLFK
jgi:hypothetical protein